VLLVGLVGCEIRLCAFVRPRAPCVPCVRSHTGTHSHVCPGSPRCLFTGITCIFINSGKMAVAGDFSTLSIRDLKQELSRRQLDYSGLSEKSELVELLRKASCECETDQSGSAEMADVDIDTTLARLSNLLDTLPASMTLLDKKWSETRQEKVCGQLKTVKHLLDQSTRIGRNNPGWQSRLEEYNQLAREFKKIRDLPRNMDG
jgi:hypothetical protein